MAQRTSNSNSTNSGGGSSRRRKLQNFLIPVAFVVVQGLVWWKQVPSWSLYKELLIQRTTTETARSLPNRSLSTDNDTAPDDDDDDLGSPTTLESWLTMARERRWYYVEGRFDRVGSALHAMLTGHAYGWHTNQTLKGICMRHQPTMPDNRDVNLEILEWLGLDRIFAYRCPPVLSSSSSSSSTAISLQEQRQAIQDEFVYTGSRHDNVTPWNNLGTDQIFQPDRHSFPTYLTPDWLHYVHTQLLPPPTARRSFAAVRHLHAPLWVSKSASSQQQTQRPRLQVAIHVRRGDVTACRYPRRYMTLAHYRRVLSHYVLDRYPQHDVDVWVYSESEALDEPWNVSNPVFKESTTSSMTSTEASPTENLLVSSLVDRSHTYFQSPHQFRLYLLLDEELKATWDGLLSADIVVVGHSTLSYITSLLNQQARQIIYTPLWLVPLRHWTLVNQTWVDQTRREIQVLRQHAGCAPQKW